MWQRNRIPAIVAALQRVLNIHSISKDSDSTQTTNMSRQELTYYQRLRRLIHLALFFIFIALPAFIYWLYQHYTYPAEALQAASFSYPPHSTNQCLASTGTAGTHRRHNTKKFGFTVKTPSNYHPHYAHPLLVVYAPRHFSAALTEEFMGLTHAATTRGLIVAYADSQPLSPSNIKALGNIAKQIAEEWCVDKKSIILAGHSDGGTASSALAFLPGSPVKPAAIISSAAGLSEIDFPSLNCPDSQSILVVHGREDLLFPEWGKQAANWWATCNQCTIPKQLRLSKQTDRKNALSCHHYANCLTGAAVSYCEHSGGHNDWPTEHAMLWGFIAGMLPD